jgi:hypothetical protein
MYDTENWDAILTLGAAIAEDVRARLSEFDSPAADDLYVLSSAMAWVVLRRYWTEGEGEAEARWDRDVPDALNRYAQRLGLDQPAFKKPA